MPPDKCALHRETDPFKWAADGLATGHRTKLPPPTKWLDGMVSQAWDDDHSGS